MRKNVWNYRIFEKGRRIIFLLTYSSKLVVKEDGDNSWKLAMFTYFSTNYQRIQSIKFWNNCITEKVLNQLLEIVKHLSSNEVANHLLIFFMSIKDYQDICCTSLSDVLWRSVWYRVSNIKMNHTHLFMIDRIFLMISLFLFTNRFRV